MDQKRQVTCQNHKKSFPAMCDLQMKFLTIRISYNVVQEERKLNLFVTKKIMAATFYFAGSIQHSSVGGASGDITLQNNLRSSDGSDI